MTTLSPDGTVAELELENGTKETRLTNQINGDGNVRGDPVKPLGEDSVVDGRHAPTGETHRKQSDIPPAHAIISLAAFS